ncbi:hypothetical protein DEO72_LG3g1182 [Vigna unguiculata]|uniref:Uncharacterized protein n=1 Tax=Vigna unguiculata TaxID=3917 RepID=A0A4D6LDR3_VIGUN|nr:hypothetical protein DEO72_LG3g1182 [Vigna unguiculata]
MSLVREKRSIAPSVEDDMSKAEADNDKREGRRSCGRRVGANPLEDKKEC